jgi:hypothetical protein
MTIKYATSFETETVGVMPSGWSSITGSWSVYRPGLAAGIHGLGSATNASGDLVIYTGSGALATQKVMLKQSLLVGNAGGNTNAICIVMRAGAAGDSGYIWTFEFNSSTSEYQTKLYKITSAGVYVLLNTFADYTTTFVIGDKLIMEAISSGSAHNFRIWRQGIDSRPTNPTYTWTDASYATGFFGLYLNRVGNTARVVADEIMYEDTTFGDLGLTWLCDSTELISSTWDASIHFGLGLLGSNVPTTGSDGPSPLRACLTPTDTNTEFMYRLVTPPSAGILILNENGSAIFSGAPAGSYTFVFSILQGGVNLGNVTAYINSNHTNGRIPILNQPLIGSLTGTSGTPSITFTF